MSKFEKLIEEIVILDKGLRFEELAKALESIGYMMKNPRGGSSHFIFRKDGKLPITIPKAAPVKRAYIKMVRDAILEYESED